MLWTTMVKPKLIRSTAHGSSTEYGWPATVNWATGRTRDISTATMAAISPARTHRVLVAGCSRYSRSKTTIASDTTQTHAAARKPIATAVYRLGGAAAESWLIRANESSAAALTNAAIGPNPARR